MRSVNSSPTFAPIAGTKCAAYNAVTEYLDHIAPVRGARIVHPRAAHNHRSRSAGSLKAQAFAMLQTL